MAFPPFRFKGSVLWLLDQRRLPQKESWLRCSNSRQVYRSIRNMTVRGAPAIGIVGGYGLFLGIANFKGERQDFFRKLKKEAEFLKSARPTGVNLRNIIDRIVEKVVRADERNVNKLKQLVLEEAKQAHREDDEICRRMGAFGAALFQGGDHILTHCNAGGLATSGYGTALGVIYAAQEKGRRLHVFADETRPLLQGARLTAWELAKSRIPCTLLCDNAAASLMKAGKIDGVIVGADRIAANGDTANKIGTYNLAALAKWHGIPFYVAAPSTTFDFHIRSGKGIPIENRNSSEVTEGFGKRIAPWNIDALNPAFDVTPHSLVTAFVTEAGILRPPFKKSFLKLKRQCDVPVPPPGFSRGRQGGGRVGRFANPTLSLPFEKARGG